MRLNISTGILLGLNVSHEPPWYSQGSQHPAALATSARSPASVCLRSSSPLHASSRASAWRHAGSGHQESGPLLPSRKQGELQAQEPSCDRMPPGTRLTVPTGICALGPVGKRNTAAAVRCSRWGQAGDRRGGLCHGTAGRLLPACAVGLAKPGVPRQQQRELFWEWVSVAQSISSCSRLWLSIPSSLAPVKVQQPPGPRPRRQVR